MTTGHVYIATSLDGFVAGTGHRLDWLTKQQTAGEDHGYDQFIDSVDGLVMGRGSYENVLTFGDWPYKKPVWVMTKSMSPADVPPALADKVRFTDLEPPALMQALDREGWSRAYIDGGRVVQSFIRCGLIADLVLTTIPILIGDGHRLFGPIEQDIDLALIGTQSFKSGLVQTRYRVLPPSS